MIRFGSIILVRFPFTDLSGDKRRPALVVSADCSAEDVIMCFITSVPQQGLGCVPIGSGGDTGLKRPSIVRFDKIATLAKALVSGDIGEASAEWLEGNASRFFDVFGFKPEDGAVPHGPAPYAL